MSAQGEYLRSWRNGAFTLSLYSLGRDDKRGKEKLGYKLTHNGRVVFEGGDLFASPLHGIDSDAAAGACIHFLSLKPGDTDAEYFEKYTPEQLAFAEKYGDDLSLWAMALEEGRQTQKSPQSLKGSQRRPSRKKGRPRLSR